MPRGDKSRYTEKQKRMAEHIEESVEDRGGDEDEAERIAWATVNKYTGGALKGSAAEKQKKAQRARKNAKRPSPKSTGPAKTTGSTRKRLSRAGRKGAAAAGENIIKESTKSGGKRRISESTRRKLSAAGKKGAAARKRKRS